MLPWKLQKHQVLPVTQNLSSVYFSLAKFQLVSCNLCLAMIWQMTYTLKLPKSCSATLSQQYNVCKWTLYAPRNIRQTILEKGTVKSLSSKHHLVAGEFVKASCMGYQVLNYKQVPTVANTVVSLVTKLKNRWLGIAFVAKCVATKVNKNFNIKKEGSGLC